MSTIRDMYKTVIYHVKLQGGITPGILSKLGVKQGCVLSPLLFKLFIADLPAIFDSSCDPVSLNDKLLRVLMYADDIVMLSTSEVGLKNCLKKLNSYCEKWNLTVNTSKTQVMIFNKTGHLFNNYKFYLGETLLKVTDSYTYLGITFKPSGSFRQALFDLKDKARRAYFKFRRHDTADNVKLTFKFFDVLVKPILMYCSEVWTILVNSRLSDSSLLADADSQIYESLNLTLCKYLLGVRRNTSNIASRGELGRYPLLCDSLLQTYCFKSRISSCPGLVNDAYEESLKLSEKSWANLLKTLPQKLSCFDDHGYFKDELLKALYRSHWLTKLYKHEQGEENKLEYLALVKTDFCIENYVVMLPLHARRDFAKLRTSSHPLEIEVARYTKPKPPREQRKCKLCKSDSIEDELHLLLRCSHYSDTRKTLFSRFAKLLPFELNDSLECFKKLFSCHQGFPPATKLVCALAKSLLELRKLFFEFVTEPVTKVTVTSRGRESKPPIRYTDVSC